MERKYKIRLQRKSGVWFACTEWYTEQIDIETTIICYGRHTRTGLQRMATSGWNGKELQGGEGVCLNVGMVIHRPNDSGGSCLDIWIEMSNRNALHYGGLVCF